ncbi:MAG: hypothetical protein ABIU87_06290 [Ornithinibacter sp.]
MGTSAWDADARAIRTRDGVVVFWVVFWLAVGAWTGYQLWQLTGLAASTVDSGRSLGSAAEALQKLSSVPLIGERTGALGEQIGSTAEHIVSSGQQADRSIRGVSVLLGVSLAVAPAGAVLMFYLPARMARRREAHRMREALSSEESAAPLMALLAHRAVGSLPPTEVLAISADPYADLAAGRHEDLAAAELERLGIDPGPRASP